MWEWHKRSLRVNTRLQRESAINTIQYDRVPRELIWWCLRHTLGDNAAFVNPAGQLLLTRRGKTIMDGVGILIMDVLQAEIGKEPVGPQNVTFPKT